LPWAGTFGQKVLDRCLKTLSNKIGFVIRGEVSEAEQVKNSFMGLSDAELLPKLVPLAAGNKDAGELSITAGTDASTLF
jgi:hypothetical protein